MKGYESVFHNLEDLGYRGLKTTSCFPSTKSAYLSYIERQKRDVQAMTSYLNLHVTALTPKLALQAGHFNSIMLLTQNASGVRMHKLF